MKKQIKNTTNSYLHVPGTASGEDWRGEISSMPTAPWAM